MTLLEHGVGISGEIRAILYDLNMNTRYDSGWSPNLITNNGMDKIWENLALGYTSIGDGNTAAQFTDTELDNNLATVATVIGAGDAINVGASSPNWEYSRTRSRRFGAGIGTGTIREAAASYNNDGTDLFNRVVLPSPIVKGTENVLDIIFRRTIWPDLTDHISTATFKSVVYDTITRVSEVDQESGADAWEPFKIADSGSATWIAYDGDIGSVDGKPVGNSDNGGTGDGWTTETYVPGNFYRDIRYFAGLEDWVLGANIRCLVGNLTLMRIQTQFDKQSGGGPVPKDNTEIMDFGWRYKWSRV